MIGWLVCGTGKLVSSSSSVSGGGGRGGAVSRGSGGRGGAWSTFTHQQHQHRSLAPPTELTTDFSHAHHSTFENMISKFSCGQPMLQCTSDLDSQQAARAQQNDTLTKQLMLTSSTMLLTLVPYNK